MSKARLVARLGLISILFVLSASCAGNKNHKHSKEHTSDYICPMHCEGSGSEKPGTCPVCGMDYVKNKKTK
jgi:hypothetical protein